MTFLAPTEPSEGVFEFNNACHIQIMTDIAILRSLCSLHVPLTSPSHSAVPSSVSRRWLGPVVS